MHLSKCGCKRLPAKLTGTLHQTTCPAIAVTALQVWKIVHNMVLALRMCGACIQYLDLWPDTNNVSCMSAFNRTHTANYIDRTGGWHHLAVTWTKAGNGRTRIYKDGLLMAEVPLPTLLTQCCVYFLPWVRVIFLRSSQWPQQEETYTHSVHVVFYVCVLFWHCHVEVNRWCGALFWQTASGKTKPLQSGGAFMLGGEQDCYGGCTDAGQAFYGLMDEVGAVLCDPSPFLSACDRHQSLTAANVWGMGMDWAGNNSVTLFRYRQ